MLELPPGGVDPLFLAELALELHMPMGEIGQRMSAHELTVLWPAFFAYRQRQQDKEDDTQRL